MFLYLQFQIEKLKIEEWPEMVNNLKNSGPHSQFVAFDMQCLHYYHNYHYHYYWISLLLNVIIIWHPVPACSSKLSKSFFKIKTWFCLLGLLLRIFLLVIEHIFEIFLLVIQHIIEHIFACWTYYWVHFFLLLSMWTISKTTFTFNFHCSEKHAVGKRKSKQL